MVRRFSKHIQWTTNLPSSSQLPACDWWQLYWFLILMTFYRNTLPAHWRFQNGRRRTLLHSNTEGYSRVHPAWPNRVSFQQTLPNWRTKVHPDDNANKKSCTVFKIFSTPLQIVWLNVLTQLPDRCGSNSCQRGPSARNLLHHMVRLLECELRRQCSCHTLSNTNSSSNNCSCSILVDARIGIQSMKHTHHY